MTAPTFQVTKWKPASDKNAAAIRLGWAASLAVRGIRTEEHFLLERGVQLVALFRDGDESISKETVKWRKRHPEGTSRPRDTHGKG